MVTKQQAQTANPVNEYHKQLVNELPALSPLHDTFRTGRYFKKNWTSR